MRLPPPRRSPPRRTARRSTTASATSSRSRSPAPRPARSSIRSTPVRSRPRRGSPSSRATSGRTAPGWWRSCSARRSSTSCSRRGSASASCSSSTPRRTPLRRSRGPSASERRRPGPSPSRPDPGHLPETHSGFGLLYPAPGDLRHRRKLHQGRLVHRGLPGGLHPPEAGRARLRDRGAALHRPGRLHRLRRLRRGVSGGRDLPGLRGAREVRLRARPERGVLLRPRNRRAHRGVMQRRGPRVAIVGAGPAGAFAAAALLRARGDAEIDLFERLPTPWGLLRGGVAPDHQEIKRLEDTFDRETLERGCRFLGNVEVGVDISHAELMRGYAAVIYATGAQTDKSLGIPGEDLPGSRAATEFVGWYNGHPDYRDLDFDLSVERAVVIGNGNVAADVTRILTLSLAELKRTDVADHALEALRESRIREVVVLGRRGPAQAAFTSAELRELGRLDGVDTRVDPAEIELDPVSREWLEAEGTFKARKNVELLREIASRPPDPTAERRIVLRFLRSPVEIRGAADGVQAVDVRRNEIVRADDGTLRAKAVGDEVETTECGLVLRSVGYRAVPLPDVPFEERRFVLPNDRGRVLTPEGDPLPGVYTVGWIKRGPTGILGTNKRDAQETIACLVEDLRADALAPPAPDAAEEIDALLAERCRGLVTVEGWRTIDGQEVERGRADDRPRVKLASREELLDAANAAPHA